jgi:hypothetical protein
MSSSVDLTVASLHFAHASHLLKHCCLNTSLPVRITACTHHCLYASLSLRITAVTHHCCYASLPLRIAAVGPRSVRRCALQNFLTYRIAATMQLVFFFFIALLAFDLKKYQPEGKEWPEFFFVPVLLLLLITVLNDGTLITIGYDNVKAPDYPAKV